MFFEKMTKSMFVVSNDDDDNVITQESPVPTLIVSCVFVDNLQ
jgi:hypothetical protein